jgi:parallel beta-helix repeat protein
VKRIKEKHVVFLLVALILVLSLAFTVQFTGSSRRFSRITEASYIVFIEDRVIYAENGKTGFVEYSGSDASSVIQAALNSLGSNGGIIWIREGTYVITSTIRVPGNVTLRGTGFATKLILADSADQEVIANKHTEDYVDSNIVISNLQIDGNGAKQTPGAQVSTIFFSRVSRSRVENCWIHGVAPGSTNAGVYALYSSYLTVRGNVIYDNSYAGVFLASGTNAIIVGNVFYHNHRGVYLAGHLNGVVKGNQIVSGDEGVRLYMSASSNLIEGNSIRDNSEEGIVITHRKGVNNLIIGNSLVNNVVQILDNGTSTIIRHNEGYRTENYGVVSVVNGSYVLHGLVATPRVVQLTSANRRVVAVVFKNSTHIEIGLWSLDGDAVTVPGEVYWSAEV